MVTTPVCLGIDPQSKRLGLALVEFEPPHCALWADTVSIDREDGGWLYQQVAHALFLADFKAYEDPGGYEITRVGIELPPYVNNRAVYRNLSIVFGLVGAECHRRWPWAPQVTCDVGMWKKGVLGNGRAKKWEVAETAINAAPTAALANVFAEQQDACDAWAIAHYAARVELQGREAA